MLDPALGKRRRARVLKDRRHKKALRMAELELIT